MYVFPCLFLSVHISIFFHAFMQPSIRPNCHPSMVLTLVPILDGNPPKILESIEILPKCINMFIPIASDLQFVPVAAVQARLHLQAVWRCWRICVAGLDLSKTNSRSQREISQPCFAGGCIMIVNYLYLFVYGCLCIQFVYYLIYIYIIFIYIFIYVYLVYLFIDLHIDLSIIYMFLMHICRHL